MLQGVAEYLNGNHAHEARTVPSYHKAVEYPNKVTQRAIVTPLTVFWCFIVGEVVRLGLHSWHFLFLYDRFNFHLVICDQSYVAFG